MNVLERLRTASARVLKERLDDLDRLRTAIASSVSGQGQDQRGGDDL